MTTTTFDCIMVVERTTKEYKMKILREEVVNGRLYRVFFDHDGYNLMTAREQSDLSSFFITESIICGDELKEMNSLGDIRYETTEEALQHFINTHL